MPTSAEFDALHDKVEALETVGDSAIALITGLAPLIVAAAGDKAASLDLATEVEARAATWAAAVTANTPSGPPTP